MAWPATREERECFSVIGNPSMGLAFTRSKTGCEMLVVWLDTKEAPATLTLDTLTGVRRDLVKSYALETLERCRTKGATQLDVMGLIDVVIQELGMERRERAS